MQSMTTIRRGFNWTAMVAMLSTLALLLSAPSFAQKKTKNSNTTDTVPMPPMPTPDELEDLMGHMLGAWQVGDVDAMHKYYADDATFTSGAYEPPIIGWQNYLSSYQKQRERIQGMQFVRRNTVIRYRSDFAWATYQWELSATVDNKQMSAFGHTTLVFAKTGDHWLIVHNHTSQVCDLGTPAPAALPQPQPGQPPKSGN
jgi:ketosteroid isomerase-like protein